MSDVTVEVSWVDPPVISIDLEDPEPITFEFVETSAGGGGTTATHTQGVPSTTWTFVHNLGYKPSITMFLNDGTQFYAPVSHVDVNTAVITLAVAISGTALAS